MILGLIGRAIVVVRLATIVRVRDGWRLGDIERARLLDGELDETVVRCVLLVRLGRSLGCNGFLRQRDEGKSGAGFGSSGAGT